MQQEAIDCLLHDTQSVHVDSVDDMLEKYKGNEEELFRKLEAKYGEEPVETKEEEPDPIEALDKELEEERKKIAAIEAEVEVAKGVGTRSLTVATSPSASRKDSATSPTGTASTGTSTVASAYQIKLLELSEAVREGTKELQEEYIEEYGADWSEDPELLFKYSDMIKQMTKIKQDEINRTLKPYEHIEHIIMIDELPQERFVQSTIQREESVYEGYGDDYTVQSRILNLGRSLPKAVVPPVGTKKIDGLSKPFEISF